MSSASIFAPIVRRSALTAVMNSVCPVIFAGSARTICGVKTVSSAETVAIFVRNAVLYVPIARKMCVKTAASVPAASMNSAPTAVYVLTVPTQCAWIAITAETVWRASVRIAENIA